ncbi:MAG: bactofilin family protein [Myxococcota bacterium]
MSKSSRARPESAATNHADGPPLVPSEGLFEGQVAVVGETRIAGAVIGTLRGPGTLRLDPSASIEGPIDCEILESAGRIVGTVQARSRARLTAGNHLEGDVEAPVLEVEDDAVWNGKARIGS